MHFRRCRHRTGVGDSAANHRPSPEVTSSNLRRGGRLGSTRQGHALAPGMLVPAGLLPACGGPDGPAARTAEAEANAREAADRIVTDLRTPTVVDTRTADDIGRTLTARSDASLATISPDEPAVRAALARLTLDPTVRVDVAAQDAVVGVALRHPAGTAGYGCLFARVRAGAVEVWQPSEVQLVPGELACRAAESLAGHGRQPPS